MQLTRLRKFCVVPFAVGCITTASKGARSLWVSKCQLSWTDSLELCPREKVVTTDQSKHHLRSTVHLPAIVRGVRSNMYLPALRTFVHWHDQQATTQARSQGGFGGCGRTPLFLGPKKKKMDGVRVWQLRVQVRSRLHRRRPARPRTESWVL